MIPLIERSYKGYRARILIDEDEQSLFNQTVLTKLSDDWFLFESLLFESIEGNGKDFDIYLTRNDTHPMKDHIHRSYLNIVGASFVCYIFSRTKS